MINLGQKKIYGWLKSSEDNISIEETNEGIIFEPLGFDFFVKNYIMPPSFLVLGGTYVVYTDPFPESGSFNRGQIYMRMMYEYAKMKNDTLEIETIVGMAEEPELESDPHPDDKQIIY